MVNMLSAALHPRSLASLVSRAAYVPIMPSWALRLRRLPASGTPATPLPPAAWPCRAAFERRGAPDWRKPKPSPAMTDVRARRSVSEPYRSGFEGIRGRSARSIRRTPMDCHRATKVCHTVAGFGSVSNDAILSLDILRLHSITRSRSHPANVIFSGFRSGSEKRADFSGARNAGTGDRAEHTTRRSEAERPAGLYPRGIVALTPQGEPAVSQSEGPCGPSEVTSGNVTEGRSEAERDTDPLPSSAAAEVGVGAQGRSGVPTGLSTPDAIASANERTGARAVAPQAPQPVGLDTTGLERHRSERRMQSSCQLRWRELCRLDH